MKIEWTEATCNPATGCDRISPGCDHCQALALAKRRPHPDLPAQQTRPSSSRRHTGHRVGSESAGRPPARPSAVPSWGRSTASGTSGRLV
ncbi:DUF5131 family protein [Nonomuraea antimicrobica]